MRTKALDLCSGDDPIKRLQGGDGTAVMCAVFLKERERYAELLRLARIVNSAYGNARFDMHGPLQNLRDFLSTHEGES